MKLFSVVFQDFRLLSFGLGQNVAGSMNVDMHSAEQCLRDAGFGTRLDKLPQGLSTTLYKDFDAQGIDISGGEAQKIALARALYKDAPFVILDEPTAALDPIAEAEIYENFNTLIRNKTAIYISHRMSSCKFCDRIVVLGGGQILEEGNHETLLEEKGTYYRLYSAQEAYYKN